MKVRDIVNNTKKVRNIINSNGNKVKNQFEICTNEGVYFQSYDTIIAFVDNEGQVYLDQEKYDCSRTTSRHRNHFLGKSTKEIEKEIKTGKIILRDLNQ